MTMQHLLFSVGTDFFAIPLREIEVILPVPILDPLLQAVDSVVGMLRFRGRRIPVIDVRMLGGSGPIRRLISTRLVLVQNPEYSPSHLALLVEHALEVVQLKPLDPAPDASPQDELGWLHRDPMSSGVTVVRVVNWQNLLTEEVLALGAGESLRD